MSRVILIGAGMGGLAAALELAADGHEVTLYEAGPRPGGKAGVVVHDGVAADTGPSVLTMPEVLLELFDAAGVAAEERVTLRPLPQGTRYLYPDGAALDLGNEPAPRRAAVAAALGPAAADELEAFLTYARGIWQAAAPHFVLGDAPTFDRLVRIIPVALRELPRIDALRTMDAALRARVRDERLRWLLARFATYNGSDPRRAPATLHCIAHVEVGAGIWGVQGGMHALARCLADAAARRGAVLRYGVPVRAVLTEHGRVVGVRTDEGDDHADAVVVNADVAHLTQHLLPPDAARRVRQPGEPSTSGWTAVLRARRRPEAERPAHAVLFPPRYPDEFVDLFDHRRPPATPTVYLCAQEKAHGVSGWPEHEPLFVMANAPAEPDGGRSEPATWSRLADVVLRRLRDAGLIDPDDAVIWSRTPTDLAAAFPGSRGAIYGAASNDRFAAFKRPPNRVRAVPGLYLASGSAHPGGGVPMCLLSGRAAARAVRDDLAR